MQNLGASPYLPVVQILGVYFKMPFGKLSQGAFCCHFKRQTGCAHALLPFRFPIIPFTLTLNPHKPFNCCGGDTIKKLLPYGAGLLTGLLNGLLGAGGGMIAVPMLRASGLDEQQAHATSIAVIVPLSLVSAWLYLTAGRLEFSSAMVYLPGGLAGALAGSWLLPRIKTTLLRRIFGCVMVWSALRLLL